jgi:hypothetical protein
LGTHIETSAEQPLNACFEIRESLHPGSKVSDVRFFILRRAPAEIIVSDAGRESDVNIAHPENTSDSVVPSSGGDSKVIEDSAEQREKHSAPSRRTVFGIQIDSSEQHSENSPVDISASRDPDSKVTDESDRQ